MNPLTMEQSARDHFCAELRDKVRHLANYCLPFRVTDKVKELNAIIGAGHELRVTKAKTFSDREVAEITKDLMILRTLKMRSEALDHLVCCLVHRGLSAEIFEGLSGLTPTRQEMK